jgi:uncharacterized damage-inducible protein DinB
MPINESIIAEVKHEAAKTRRILERVPLDKSDWKPHEKSMAIGRLAIHIAELPTWTRYTLAHNELDFAKMDYKPPVVTTNDELVAIHEKNVADAIAVLEATPDATFQEMWTMRRAEQVFFTLPKNVVLRDFTLNHLYHHRGQLSVYLRLLDVPVPGMYGPTADDTM